MANTKEIREIRCVSSVAIQAMETPEFDAKLNDMITKAPYAQRVQGTFVINGTERTIRATYRRGVVTISAPTGA